jgi:ribosome modulation factor
MLTLDEQIYAEGQNAFERGEPPTSCPYGQSGRSRSLWLAGWDEACRFERLMTGEAASQARLALPFPNGAVAMGA